MSIEPAVWRQSSVIPTPVFHTAEVHRVPQISLQRSESAEIIYIERGVASCEKGSVPQSVGAGNLVVIGPATSMQVRINCGNGCSILSVTLPGASARSACARYFDTVESFWGGSADGPRIFQLNSVQQIQIERAFQRLSSREQTQLSLDHFLLDLMDILTETQVPSLMVAAPDWLERACVEIRTRQNFVRGARALAALANRSMEHVARETKRWLGRTPTEIVNEARMEFAAKQLAYSGSPIIEIAMDCGFESLSHFYRVFEKFHGRTPRRYRQQHQSLQASGNERAPAVRYSDTEPAAAPNTPAETVPSIKR